MTLHDHDLNQSHEQFHDQSCNILKLKKSNLTIKLNDIRKQSLGDEEGQDKFYEIIDFGEIDNFFFQKENRYMTALENVAIISKENNVIKKISYSLNGFSPNNIFNTIN